MDDETVWLDDLGNEHSPASKSPRILSLVPSVTESLFDLGLGRNIVGRTTYCVHPADGVDLVPTVGGTKKINMERALQLKPTHAIVNVDENPKEMADELGQAGVEVVVTHPLQPIDNVRLFALLGGLFGRRTQAEQLTAEFMVELAHLQNRKGDRHSKRVLYLIWKDPWMTVSRDTYISRMLALIDWNTIGHDAETRYPVVAMESALPSVDAVLFASEPYAFTPVDAEMFRSVHSEFPGEVRWVNGELISWYGSRAILGLKYLVGLAEGKH